MRGRFVGMKMGSMVEEAFEKAQGRMRDEMNDGLLKLIDLMNSGSLYRK